VITKRLVDGEPFSSGSGPGGVITKRLADGEPFSSGSGPGGVTTKCLVDGEPLAADHRPGSGRGTPLDISDESVLSRSADGRPWKSRTGRRPDSIVQDQQVAKNPLERKLDQHLKHINSTRMPHSSQKNNAPTTTILPIPSHFERHIKQNGANILQ
jgi:hypothetical protein